MNDKSAVTLGHEHDLNRSAGVVTTEHQEATRLSFLLEHRYGVAKGLPDSSSPDLVPTGGLRELDA
jgi:hypothetical protein